MSGTPEQKLLETRESRRSVGLVRGILLPLTFMAVAVGLPYLIYVERHYLAQHLPPALQLQHWQEMAIGFAVGALPLLVWWLGFLGRQTVTITSERVLVEYGFWSKVRDDVEVFRIRDVVVTRSLLHRLLGVGNITIKATGGLGQPEEIHQLRGLPSPVTVSETIRRAWNIKGRPERTSNIDG